MDRENGHQRLRDRAEYTTEDPEDINGYDQPPNVNDRPWTVVAFTNPIWMQYHKKLRELKDWCDSRHQQMSGCENCETIFYPNFPADYHLHDFSPEFKTAVHKTTVYNCDVAWGTAPNAVAIYETFQYKAL